ncbi:MAG TPA: radical SAM protein [bacterium]|nr:radical SAM protein [bacterium]
MKTFPYGIATIYSVLKEHGHTVDFIDCDFEHKHLHELISAGELSKYNIIGIGGLVSCYKTVKHDLIPFVRSSAPDALILVGGYLGISTRDLLLKQNLCDVVFQGDSEESILEFLNVYNQPNRWKDIVGLAFRTEDGSVVDTGYRILESLESVYVPYYKYIDIEKYNSHLEVSRKSYPLVVEIGCPRRCSFCFNSFGRKVVNRSPVHVIEEIRIALEKYGYPRVDMMSENLLSRPQWVREFCERIDRYHLRFKWSACGHAKTLKEDVLSLAKTCGLDHIGIGFENFSQKILDNMNKHTDVTLYAQIIRLLRKLDLEFTGTCIFGYFGEDDQTVQENIDFNVRNFINHKYFWIQAYPLTRCYEQCLEKGLIPDEEAYIEKLGDAAEFVINLTEFPDDELFRMRDRLYAETLEGVTIRHPFEIRKICRAARYHGWKWILQRIASKITRIARTNSG